MSTIQGNKSAVANLFVQSSGNLHSIFNNQGVVKKEEKEAEDFTYILLFSLDTHLWDLPYNHSIFGVLQPLADSVI